ncbi:hypothetical protein HG530_008206 [Fusarium avenaceum]|nr:hypothetical protein HG530_008206 [Fusarium avenaceum]
MLLFIADKMLDRRHHPGVLNAANCLSSSNALQVRVGAKSFPVASASRSSSKRPNGRTKNHIDTLAFCFLSMSIATLIHQLFVEGGSHCNSSRPSGRVICKSYAKRPVLQSQGRESNVHRSARCAHGQAHTPSCASGDVDFLSQCHFADQLSGQRVALLPVLGRAALWAWVPWR